MNEPNQAFQLAPLIPALEEVSGKVIGRSLLAGAGWILTLLCLSGDTRREPLEMLPRGEDWPGPISSSVYDQLSAEEAQRYNELRYKKAAGKASDQESRDFQELEEKLVEGESESLVDLVGHRRDHILNRHRGGTGKPGKTEFPSSWSDDRIIEEVNRIASDPGASGGVGKWNSPYKIGIVDGIEIRVDFYPSTHPTYSGKVSTAYPINTTPNP